MLERAVLRCSIMTSLDSSKYLILSEQMVLALHGSLLIIAMSIYSKILRKDSASTSLKACRRSIIHSTMSFLRAAALMTGLLLTLMVLLFDDSLLISVIPCIFLR